MNQSETSEDLIALPATQLSVLTGGDSAGIGDQLGFTFLPQRLQP